MEISKLLTLGFDKNVGSLDRVFRLLSGAALALAGWFFGLPPGVSVAMSVLGAMWFATGIVSKCSIYYALGYSSRKSRD